MPNPYANQYHGNPQQGPDGVLYYPDGSIARPDGSIYNPPTGPQHSALGGGTAGMPADYKYNKMSGNRDNRRTGVYSSGGQVNPNTPPAGPYGSSNPGRDQKEKEMAARHEAMGVHPMNVGARGQHVLTNPDNPSVTYHKRVTNGRVSYYGRWANPNAPGGYEEFNPYKARVSNQGDGIIQGQDTYFTGTMGREDPNEPRSGYVVKEGQVKIDPKTGKPALDASGHQQVVGGSHLHGSQANIRDNYLGSQNQGATPAENVIRGSSASSSSAPYPRYPKMSASLNKPISEFGIEDGIEHLQKLYDKQRELMEQGANSQNSDAARALRQRAMELDDHITKLKKSAALKTPEQLEADGERPLPPIKPPQYVGPLETDWEQGMHSFDKDGSGGLNQEELRAWRRWKQVGQGKRPDHRGNIVGEGHPNFTKHGSSTQMTPPGMMPGYTIGGGRDTTGTQHQDTGGVNPDAPLFAPGMGFGTPPLGAPDDPSVSGQDMMQQFPPGMPNPTPDVRLETNYGVDPNAGRLAPGPAEQAGMVDSVSAPAGELSATQQQGISNIIKLIETGKRSFQEVMDDPKIPGEIKSYIFQADTDGDGKLSKREIKNSDFIHTRMENATRPGSGGDRNGLLARIRANRQQRRGN